MELRTGTNEMVRKILGFGADLIADVSAIVCSVTVKLEGNYSQSGMIAPHRTIVWAVPVIPIPDIEPSKRTLANVIN